VKTKAFFMYWCQNPIKARMVVGLIGQVETFVAFRLCFSRKPNIITLVNS